MDTNTLMKTLAVNLADMSGLAWFLRPFYGGCGAVLALHRVLPAEIPVFEEGNVIRAEQLRQALHYIRRGGWEFASLDEIPDRLRGASGRSQRFLAITLDDGYRDNLTYGLPIFREFGAPFAVFPVTGFVNRTQVYTPVLITALFGITDCIVLRSAAKGTIAYPIRTRDELRRSMASIFAGWNEKESIAAIRSACAEYGLDVAKVTAEHYLSWQELRTLAKDPLATIGVHTVSHAALAKLSEADARQEMAFAKEELQRELGIPIEHIAYPYGASGQCGEREFQLARDLGFRTGYTTHRGNLHHRHSRSLWSLPRHTISMARHSANVRYLRLSLSGLWDSPVNGTLVKR